GEINYHRQVESPSSAIRRNLNFHFTIFNFQFRMPSNLSPAFDLITMGRSSIDLYSNEVGAAFVDIKSFAAYVGGSPTNIAVGARRLGLRTAVLTAVGEDPVGDFILHFLKAEGVETKFVQRKPGTRTSAVVLGIEPPDKFP